MFEKRLERVRKQLLEEKIDLLIVDDPVNIFYLTGIEVSSGRIVLTHDHAFFLVDGRYQELCKKQSPMPVLMTPEASLKALLNEPGFQNVKIVAFDRETTTYKVYEELAQNVVESNHEIKLVAVSNLIKKIRAVKDVEEIAIMREAAKLGYEGYQYVCSMLKEGITELELAFELEIFWKRKGGKKPAFDPIIAFGNNGSMPHYRASNAVLKQGQSVLIDIGVMWKNYHSDLTRVQFFGSVNSKIVEIFEIVQEAQKIALEACKPGTIIGQLDAIARNYIAKRGYGDHFTHSLGHGIGLEVHEWPLINQKGAAHADVLQAGMVITIEPGIYLEGIGGVRIEDTIVITRTGFENLIA